MAISVQCPGCQKQLKAKDEFAGMRVKCPACGTSVIVAAVVPRPAEQQPVPAAGSPLAEPQPVPTAPPSRLGLEGLSPDYSIRLGHWFDVARPHYRAVLGPFIGYFLLFLLIVAGYFLISWSALALLSEFLFEGLALALLPIVWLIAAVLILTLAIGFHVVCQAQFKGNPWTFGTFFSGFRWTWKLAGRAVLLLLVELAATLPAVVIPALGRAIWREPPLMVVGLTAALVLGCSLAGGYVWLRCMIFSHLLIIDRGCGTVESLRGSWLLSRDHFWGLLGTMLLVLGAVCLTPLLLLGLHLLIDMPVPLLLPLLALGMIAQLFALPAGILLLNAGYLLVAGAAPLPGHQRDSERAVPRAPAARTWLPAAAVGAAVLVFGFGMALLESAERARVGKEIDRRREEAVRYDERARLAEARAREEAEQQAKNLVAFFREGGCWSMELFGWDEPSAEPAAVEAGPPRAPGGEGGLPSAGSGPGGPAGAGVVSRRQRVLVLGPRNLLKAKRAVPLGTPIEPGPGWEAAIQQLEEVPFARPHLLPQIFFRQFADALSNGEVEAVLVEAVLQPAPSVVSAAGAPGAGSQAGAPGVPPFGGGGLGPGAGDGVGGPGAWGGASHAAMGSRGTPVPFDKAEPLTHERFLNLVDNQDSRR